MVVDTPAEAVRKAVFKLGYYSAVSRSGYPVGRVALFDLFGVLMGRTRVYREVYWKPRPHIMGIARDVARKKYGISFSENSHVEEVIIEGIYSVYREFIPSEGEVVADVGAEFGDYALLCRKFYGAEVHTFEPLAHNIREIRRNMAMNRVTRGFTLHPVALGGSNTTVTMPYHGTMVDAFSKDKIQRTKMRTLDSYGLKPDIIKIDVEGFEMEVFKGAKDTIRKYHPRIILEVHSSRLKIECLSFLSQYGYVVRHSGKGIYIDKGKNLVQNFFLSA